MQDDNYTYRLLQKGDEGFFFQLIDSNRKRLENFFAGTVARNKTLEETERFVSEVTADIIQKKYFPFVIIETSSGRMVGYIDIKNIDWKIPKGELGYFIDKDFEKKGIVTNVLSMIIGYSMNDMNFNKLFLRTHTENTGSRRVAELNGFIVEGIIRNDYRTTDGELVDLLYYGLVKK